MSKEAVEKPIIEIGCPGALVETEFHRNKAILRFAPMHLIKPERAEPVTILTFSKPLFSEAEVEALRPLDLFLVEVFSKSVRFWDEYDDIEIKLSAAAIHVSSATYKPTEYIQMVRARDEDLKAANRAAREMRNRFDRLQAYLHEEETRAQLKAEQAPRNKEKYEHEAALLRRISTKLAEE